MTHKIAESNGTLTIRITLTDGNQYMIRANDSESLIEVRTVDGSMVILPSVSNEIKIKTNK